MDIAEYFRKNLHRVLFDKNYRKKSLLGRKESLMEARRKTRDTLRFQNRKIDINMSPILTPAQSTKKKEKPAQPETSKKKLEMLKQWKEKRNKQKQEEKKNAKPIFKVCHITRSIGLPNLEMINKEIKGKPFNIKSFAPVNHKFRAPKNIKPIHIGKAVVVKPVATKTVNTVHKNTQQSGSTLKKKVQLSKNQKQVVSDTNAVAKRTVSSSVKKTVSNASNVIKNDSVKTAPFKVKKDLPSALTKQITVPSIKVSKTVDWVLTSSSESTLAGQTKPRKIYQKTPQKPKIETRVLNDSCDSTNIITPVHVQSTGDFKTSLSNYNTPRPNKNTKQGKAQTTKKENEENSTSKLLMNREVSMDDNCDHDTDDKLPQIDQEKVIFYEDDEIVLKTPMKNIRRSIHSLKTQGRQSSSRKTLGKKDKCKICPISPLDKTPATAKNKTPKNKTPKTRKQKSTTKKRTPIAEGKTPKTKAKRKSLRNSEKLLQKEETKSLHIFTTPEPNKDPPVYISPFVTISRGKDSARKEYNIRKSTGGHMFNTPDGRDFSETTSPQAGAEYFENLLDKEISRIESLCEKWNKYKEENSIPEETDNMIDVAVGQSKLLIAKKFQQFRGLIAQCKSSKFEETPISCGDLHGFWDMMYGAVKDLNKRFDNLERLKDNNWEEIIPVKKVMKKPARTRPKKAVATSSLRQMIQAARNKANKEDVTEIQILKPKTPEYKMFSPVKRRSLRVSLLQGPTLKRMSSPGLAMMKITQAIKAGNGLTPVKSILKTDMTMSPKRKTKSVLFIDNVGDAVSREVMFTPENKENDSRRANAVQKENGVLDSPVGFRKSRRKSKIS